MGLYDCKEGSSGPDTIVANVQRAVEVLRAVNCFSKVLVMGLLPIGVNSSSMSWGSSPYRKCIEAANSKLQQMVAAKDREEDQGAVVFKDCGGSFLRPGGETLNSQLLPDGSELSGLGYAHLALCVSEAIMLQPVAKPSAYPEGFDFTKKGSTEGIVVDRIAGVRGRNGLLVGAMWKFGDWSECTAR
jgi:hypothetical protein